MIFWHKFTEHHTLFLQITLERNILNCKSCDLIQFMALGINLSQHLCGMMEFVSKMFHYVFAVFAAC